MIGRPLERVALVIGACALLLGAGELILRVLPAWSGVARARFNPYRSDGILGFALRPGADTVHTERDFTVAVRVNALGMRGPGRSPERRAGVARVLLLGDSFAFGFGVPEEAALGARLEQHLGERIGPVEVLSAAVPGWSTDQHFLYLRSRGLALAPDLVILAACENDLAELAWNRLTLDGEGLPVRIETTWRRIDATGRMRYVDERRRGSSAWSPPGEAWLLDHALVYHWLRARLVGLSAWGATRGERPPPPAWLQTDPGHPIERLAAEDLHTALAASPAFQLRYHRFLVAAMERDARALGIPVRTVLVATRAGTVPPPDVRAALHAECRSRPAACLDSSDVVPLDDVGRLTFAHDPHWNAEGHRRVAEALAAWLADEPTLRLRAPRRGRRDGDPAA